MVVEIGDGHLRVALAHGRDQLGRGQRPTAERIEVSLRPLDRRGEDVAPQPGQPPHGAAEIGLLLGSARVARGGQGSASRSTLPDVRVGSSSTSTSLGTSAAGSVSASVARAFAMSNVGSALAT